MRGNKLSPEILVLGSTKQLTITSRELQSGNLILLLGDNTKYRDMVVNIKLDRIDFNLNCGVVSFCADSSYNLRINIYHNKPNTSSLINIRRILAGRVVGLVESTIYQKQQATRSVSNIADKVLLSTKHSQALSRPNLIIDNVDVKAYHSSNIGYFDKKVMEFLKSKGLSRQQANVLLIRNFFLPSLFGAQNDIINTLILKPAYGHK